MLASTGAPERIPVIPADADHFTVTFIFMLGMNAATDLEAACLVECVGQVLAGLLQAEIGRVIVVIDHGDVVADIVLVGKGEHVAHLERERFLAELLA